MAHKELLHAFQTPTVMWNYAGQEHFIPSFSGDKDLITGFEDCMHPPLNLSNRTTKRGSEIQIGIPDEMFQETLQLVTDLPQQIIADIDGHGKRINGIECFAYIASHKIFLEIFVDSTRLTSIGNRILNIYIPKSLSRKQLEKAHILIDALVVDE